MKDLNNQTKDIDAYDSGRRSRPTSRTRLEHEEYPDFELGDGSELDLDDPDVGFALSMAKRD